MSSVYIGEMNGAAIRAILRRVDRAYEQAEVLRDLQLAYMEAKPRPYHIVTTPNSDFTEHVTQLRYDEPIPLELSIIFGEIIYDLRSALDQCVFQLALNQTGVGQDQTMFPIYDSPDKFRDNGQRRIEVIGDGPRALIESLQPYPERSLPVHKSLLDLNNFSNADKHRVAHLWGLLFLLDELEVPAGATLLPTGNNTVLHDGAEICRIILESPAEEVKVSGDFIAYLIVSNPVPDRLRETINMWNVIADIKCLVVTLLGSLGQQSEPVEVEWPPHGWLG
jgi:hypothetical protein